MTTAEILEYYKQYNHNQIITNHNKAERQLYVGNMPLDIIELWVCPAVHGLAARSYRIDS